MPLLRLTTSASVSSSEAALLLSSLSGELARRLGKPESYVMTCVVPTTAMTFAGTTEPACFAELMNIGTFAPSATAALTAFLCERLSEALGVPSGRIYVSFTDAKGHLWGHDGETFG